MREKVVITVPTHNKQTFVGQKGVLIMGKVLIMSVLVMRGRSVMIYLEKTHCPESHPFVYDYISDYDACCTIEVDGDTCRGVYEYCDAPPCQSHPSVIKEETG